MVNSLSGCCGARIFVRRLSCVAAVTRASDRRGPRSDRLRLSSGLQTQAQFGDPQQIVSPGHEIGPSLGPFHSAMAAAPQSTRGLHPAEDSFDSFTQALTGAITRTTRRAAIQSRHAGSHFARREHRRRQIRQRRVRPRFVAVPPPPGGQDLRRHQGGEFLAVQVPVPQPAAERFQLGVLPWAARRARQRPNRFSLQPRLHRQGHKLPPVVAPQMGGNSPLHNQGRQHGQDLPDSKTPAHGQRQTFPRELIHHAQLLQPPPGARLVAHKIVAPHFVGPRPHPPSAAVLARAQAPLFTLPARHVSAPPPAHGRCARLGFARSPSWRN